MSNFEVGEAAGRNNSPKIVKHFGGLAVFIVDGQAKSGFFGLESFLLGCYNCIERRFSRIWRIGGVEMEDVHI